MGFRVIDQETRLEYQDKSYKWADSLDGEEVILFWTTQMYTINEETHHILGTAWRIHKTKAEGSFKYGRLKVYLRPEEYPRIISYDTTFQGTVYTVGHRGVEVKQDWLDNGRWYTVVLWGERDSIRLWEPYKFEYVKERLQTIGTSGF